MRTSLVYEDNPPPFRGRVIPYLQQDATGHWVRHYANSMYLKFFLNHGDRWEKQRASKELDMAERKMTHWERHPNWNRAAAMKAAEGIKKNWSQPAR